MSIEQLVSEIIIESVRATNEKKAYVFCNYQAHINGLAVWAEPMNTDFYDRRREFIYLFGHPARAVYFDSDGADSDLEDLLKNIKEL